jgi:hypothetical protein
MIKNLLEQDLISHYGLPKGTVVNVVATTDTEFDLVDDSQLVYQSDMGIAKYQNQSQKNVLVANYERFFKALPQSFQQNRENCDLIVCTSDNTCFFLNELTDTNKKKSRKESKAISQMVQSLSVIMGVPAINLYIQRHTDKRCCFFNKRFQAPRHINATLAFNRKPAHYKNGFNINCSEIEALGFEFWEYSGDQICSM